MCEVAVAVLHVGKDLQPGQGVPQGLQQLLQQGALKFQALSGRYLSTTCFLTILDLYKGYNASFLSYFIVVVQF